MQRESQLEENLIKNLKRKTTEVKINWIYCSQNKQLTTPTNDANTNVHTHSSVMPKILLRCTIHHPSSLVAVTASGSYQRRWNYKFYYSREKINFCCIRMKIGKDNSVVNHTTRQLLCLRSQCNHNKQKFITFQLNLCGWVHLD